MHESPQRCPERVAARITGGGRHDQPPCLGVALQQARSSTSGVFGCRPGSGPLRARGEPVLPSTSCTTCPSLRGGRVANRAVMRGRAEPSGRRGPCGPADGSLPGGWGRPPALSPEVPNVSSKPGVGQSRSGTCVDRSYHPPVTGCALGRFQPADRSRLPVCESSRHRPTRSDSARPRRDARPNRLTSHPESARGRVACGDAIGSLSCIRWWPAQLVVVATHRHPAARTS